MRYCPAKDVTCEKCKVKGHYTKACMRCNDCNEWGHKSKKSQKCSQTKSEKTDKVQNETNAIHMMALSCIHTHTSEVGVVLNKAPTSHHIFMNGVGWKACAPQTHPTLKMELAPIREDHKDFGHPLPPDTKLKSVKSTVICDTGCMSTAIPLPIAYKMGFKKKTLIPTNSCMNGAGKNDLGVVGAIIVSFKAGKSASTRQLCYVCSEIDSIYLSRQGLEELTLVDKDFSKAPAEVCSAETRSKAMDCDCGCPKRPSSPPDRIMVAPEHAKGNKQLLKKYLLDY